MVTKIGSIATAFVAVACMAACSAVETSESNPDAASTSSASSSVNAAVDLGPKEVTVLVSDKVAPSWYSDAVESDRPGEFTTGICSNDLHYYPIRLQSSHEDAYGYFAPATVQGIGGGILLSMEEEYATNGIEPFGVMLSVSETTDKVFTVDQVAEHYFIPDEELGLDPELTKQMVVEIGLCADQHLS